jgi:excinuclease ABC subunit A
MSGGEAQRVKLATELAKRATGRTVYILDEPTTGLSFQDTEALLGVLQALVEGGNTVIVIEHNLDVIKSADWLIDLGPAGGERGGHLLAVGTPEHLATIEDSATGRFLRDLVTPRADVPKSEAKPKPAAKRQPASAKREPELAATSGKGTRRKA